MLRSSVLQRLFKKKKWILYCLCILLNLLCAIIRMVDRENVKKFALLLIPLLVIVEIYLKDFRTVTIFIQIFQLTLRTIILKV